MTNEKIHHSLKFTREFNEWLMKKPDFKKNFSTAVEYYLKLALQYGKSIDEEVIKDAMELEQLTATFEHAKKDLEEKKHFIQWKHLQKASK